MFHKILVAIDDNDSELSSNIFEQAVAFAKANNSEMMLIHVLSLLDDIYPGTPYVGMPQMAWQIYHKKWVDREEMEIKRLRFLEQEATTAGIPTQFTLNYGDPGKMICAQAQTYNADLIIIGRRGLMGLNELLTGSVSNYIFHRAPCDVLTIQGKSPLSSQCEIKMAKVGSNIS
jgi:nucleotide-binding universal stress UspA family protein